MIGLMSIGPEAAAARNYVSDQYRIGGFALPAAHQRTLRTVHALECVNQKITRRTRVAGSFLQAASVLRLITAAARSSTPGP